jgi:hypothetical protein
VALVLLVWRYTASETRTATPCERKGEPIHSNSGRPLLGDLFADRTLMQALIFRVFLRAQCAVRSAFRYVNGSAVDDPAVCGR